MVRVQKGSVTWDCEVIHVVPGGMKSTAKRQEPGDFKVRCTRTDIPKRSVVFGLPIGTDINTPAGQDAIRSQAAVARRPTAGLYGRSEAVSASKAPGGARPRVQGAGPPGAAGPGNRVTFTGLVDSNGSAVADLPAGAGTMSKPPMYSCYLLFTFTATGTLAWIETGAQFNTTATCVLAQSPGAPTLRVSISNAPFPGQQDYAIVVVY